MLYRRPRRLGNERLDIDQYSSREGQRASKRCGRAWIGVVTVQLLGKVAWVSVDGLVEGVSCPTVHATAAEDVKSK